MQVPSGVSLVWVVDGCDKSSSSFFFFFFLLFLLVFHYYYFYVLVPLGEHRRVKICTLRELGLCVLAYTKTIILYKMKGGSSHNYFYTLSILHPHSTSPYLLQYYTIKRTDCILNQSLAPPYNFPSSSHGEGKRRRRKNRGEGC